MLFFLPTSVLVGCGSAISAFVFSVPLCLCGSNPLTERIRHIFISPGHNFFGHHGGPAGKHGIEEVDSVECIAGQGLRGDRFFGFKSDYKGQVTLFSWEVYQQLCAAHGDGNTSPARLRRNIIVEGVDLNALVGVEFELQGVRLEGTEECRPCY